MAEMIAMIVPTARAHVSAREHREPGDQDDDAPDQVENQPHVPTSNEKM